MRDRELVSKYPSGTKVVTANGNGTVLFVDKTGMIRVRFADGVIAKLHPSKLVETEK